MRYIFFLFLAVLIASCEQENLTNVTDIQVGKGESLKEVSINKETTRDIILSGGNGKFVVNVADSRIVTATIIEDTLRLKGIFEGKTYATILSHDLKKRIDITVVPPGLSLSQDTLRIYPRDIVKYVTATGGGDIVDMHIDDPDSVIDAKWDIKTNVVEVKAYYEGNATITFRNAEQVERKLKVLVNTDNQVTEPGIYSTRSRTAYQMIQNVLVAKKEKTGVWFYNNTRPNGRKTNRPFFTKDPLLKIAPVVNPEEGKRMHIKVLAVKEVSAFKYYQEYPVVVEQVQGRLAVLRGHGFKFITPFERSAE